MGVEPQFSDTRFGMLDTSKLETPVPSQSIEAIAVQPPQTVIVVRLLLKKAIRYFRAVHPVTLIEVKAFSF